MTMPGPIARPPSGHDGSPAVDRDGARQYRAVVERLFAAVPAHVERDASGQSGPAASLRKAVPVELEWASNRTRCTTLELGCEGFSVLLGAAPGPDERVAAVLQLGRRDTVRAQVRVASVTETQGSFRVSFAVEDASQLPRTATLPPPTCVATRGMQPVARIRTTTVPPVLERRRPANDLP